MATHEEEKRVVLFFFPPLTFKSSSFNRPSPSPSMSSKNRRPARIHHKRAQDRRVGEGGLVVVIQLHVGPTKLCCCRP